MDGASQGAADIIYPTASFPAGAPVLAPRVGLMKQTMKFDSSDGCL